jgi:nitroimidazol reductase NimA-like FMN-containing flavoprotein (pyridoxamine 5'-phosphate oxidase superfamily)
MKTPRTKLTRVPDRGRHDTTTIHAILDEALIGHVAWVAEGNRPAVIPTLIARDGENLLIHGSSASRTLRALRARTEACVEVTHVDGIVLARSAFHHSMNYRSAILYGTLEEAPDKEHALEVFTEKLVPGRWPHVRWPNRKELKATSVLQLPITEGSAKVRTGPPVDDDEDYELDVWAGVVELRSRTEAAIPDPRLTDDTAMPPHVRALMG